MAVVEVPICFSEFELDSKGFRMQTSEWNLDRIKILSDPSRLSSDFAG
jgi:hypothetical protein